MKHPRVAIRYAKAFLKLAVEEGALEQAYNDMSLLNKVCLESKEFALLLKSPIIKTDQKLKIIDEIFSSKLAEMSMTFIKIISSKKRESLLEVISKSFINIYKEYKKIEEATVTTANPLSEELRGEVVRFIKKHGNQDVELTELVDASIIGGVIIRMGGKQLDASVSNSISELKQKFNKNLYLKDF